MSCYHKTRLHRASISIYLSVSRLYLNICIYIYLDIYDVVKGSNRAHHGSHLLPLATCISACISAARCSSCGENPWIGTVISKGGALGSNKCTCKLSDFDSQKMPLGKGPNLMPSHPFHTRTLLSK